MDRTVLCGPGQQSGVWRQWRGERGEQVVLEHCRRDHRLSGPGMQRLAHRMMAAEDEQGGDPQVSSPATGSGMPAGGSTRARTAPRSRRRSRSPRWRCPADRTGLRADRCARRPRRCRCRAGCGRSLHRDGCAARSPGRHSGRCGPMDAREPTARAPPLLPALEVARMDQSHERPPCSTCNRSPASIPQEEPGRPRGRHAAPSGFTAACCAGSSPPSRSSSPHRRRGRSWWRRGRSRGSRCAVIFGGIDRASGSVITSISIGPGVMSASASCFFSFFGSVIRTEGRPAPFAIAA